jgi:3-hydroxyacyl-[acyl-carrier-protein] dehydratase
LNPVERELENILSPPREDPPGTLQSTAVFPETFGPFQGHFPGHPIVPGFVQVRLVLHMIAHNRPVAHRLARIRQCRFKSPVSPGEPLTIRAELHFEQNGDLEVSATIRSNRQVKSNLRLVLAPRSSPRSSR